MAPLLWDAAAFAVFAIADSLFENPVSVRAYAQLAKHLVRRGYAHARLSWWSTQDPSGLKSLSDDAGVMEFVRTEPHSVRHCHAVKYGRCRYNAISKRGKLLAYDDLRDWIAALERAGELKTHSHRSRSDSRNHRNRRPRQQEPSLQGSRRPCAAFPEHQGPSRIASSDQPVRLRAPHESGA